MGVSEVVVLLGEYFYIIFLDIYNWLVLGF